MRPFKPKLTMLFRRCARFLPRPDQDISPQWLSRSLPQRWRTVIIKAREYDVKEEFEAPWDDNARGRRRGGGSNPPFSRTTPNDPTRAELFGFIERVDFNKQANLVALLWIGTRDLRKGGVRGGGRGARRRTRSASNSTSSYLLRNPLLADYLEEGLEKMGFSVDDVESDVL